MEFTPTTRGLVIVAEDKEERGDLMDALAAMDEHVSEDCDERHFVDSVLDGVDYDQWSR